MAVKRKTNKDRLSSLPDHILHHILSFLDLRFVIKTTTILSKRWRYLWASIPVLNLSLSKKTDFRQFVRELFCRRAYNSGLCKLSFSHDLPLTTAKTIIPKVMRYAISHNVQHIHMEGKICFDEAFSNCESIKTLELLEAGVLPQSLDFTRLSSLRIYSCSFNFSDKIHLADPFVNCVNLKKLSIEHCQFNGQKCFRISGLQLVELKLMFSYGIDRNFKVEIAAPKLTSFSYQTYGDVNVSGLNLPSLVHLGVLVRYFYYFSMVQKEKASLDFINMLRGCCNAQYINFHSENIKVLTMVPGLLEKQNPPFTNLKSLKFIYDGDLLRIPSCVKKYLLNGSPDAEITVIKSSRAFPL